MPKKLLFALLLPVVMLTGTGAAQTPYGDWMNRPQSEWPLITMVNTMTYTDKTFPIGGCGFLLDTGADTLAVTAKHVLTYFKSPSMRHVDFAGTLKEWTMFPKNRPDIRAAIDTLINADPHEPLQSIPSERDWLLFSVKSASGKIRRVSSVQVPLAAPISNMTSGCIPDPAIP